jgi:hypothetical protein
MNITLAANPVLSIGRLQWTFRNIHGLVLLTLIFHVGEGDG